MFFCPGINLLLAYLDILFSGEFWVPRGSVFSSHSFCLLSLMDYSNITIKAHLTSPYRVKQINSNYPKRIIC